MAASHVDAPDVESVEIARHIEDMARTVHEDVEGSRQDIDGHQRAVLLSDIRRLRRELVALEYEVIDGHACGKTDAC